jgi:hypothetical protein
MEPKEKAKEIVGKFVDQPINFPFIDTKDGQCIGSGYMTYQSAKQCALIAVEEILNANPHKWSPLDDVFIAETVLVSNKEYWNEVKAEIEKL